MRQDLIDILRCPRCKRGKFSLQILLPKEEIVQGTLVCEECDQEFKINNGIPDLIYNPSEEIVKDWQKAVAGKKRFLRKARCEQIPPDKRLFYAQRGHFCDEPNGREYIIATETNVNDIVPFMNLDKTQRVLDLGAGTCWSTAKLAREGCRCVATDISTALKLELGDAFFKEYGIFFERVQACMQDLPFVDEVFDIVFATTALHHASDLVIAFKEAGRVLRSGGRLYLVNEPVVGIFNFTARRRFRKNDPLHHGEVERPYNLWQWVRALKKNGLEPIIYFPAYIDIHLRRGPAKTFLGEIIRRIWRLKILKHMLLYWVLYPLVIFWNPGVCLGITAAKNRRISFWCRFKTMEP